MRASIILPTALALLAAAGHLPAIAQGHILDNGRLHVVFADPSTGFSTTDADRVDSLSWVTSDGTSTGNLVAQGGPLHCGDPQEHFGQAYGEASSAHPYLVGDSFAVWKSKPGNTLKGDTRTDTSKVCDVLQDGGAASHYKLSTNPASVNQMTVQRIFTFTVTNTTGNIRAYVPRLPIGTFATVHWPNAAGVVQTGNAGGCPGVCEVTDWNGKWFSEVAASGQGLVVIRNPAKGLPAVIAFDNDSFSASNNSAVALKLPAGGWTGKVSETENLCFFDAKTWSVAQQAAGGLPTGCSSP